MKGIMLLTVVVCIMVSGTALCRTWYIKSDGTGDAPTIQAGIDSAAAGDTVLVAPGAYLEHDILTRGGICIRGETGDPESAILDAENLGKGFICDSLTSVISIEGLTVTRALLPGGVHCAGSTLILRECKFTGIGENSIHGYVGAVHSVGSSVQVIGCSFSSNYGGSVVVCYSSHVELERCMFTNNTTRLIYSHLSTLTVTYCVFRDNPHTRYNYMMLCGQGPVNFLHCEVSRNPGLDYILDLSGGPGVVADCTFYENSASCAVLQCESSEFNIESCTFHKNEILRPWPDEPCIRFADAIVHVENTIVSSTIGGPAIVELPSPVPPSEITLCCCDLYANEGGEWVGAIADQYGINGNFSACPSFCNVAGGDFRLCNESPCAPGNHPDGYDCGLIGAWPVGCSCGPSRTEGTTWGKIKSIYR